MQDGFSLAPRQAVLAALSSARRLTGATTENLADFLNTVPVLADIDQAQAAAAIAMADDIADAADGFDTLLDILAASLQGPQAETAYILCADFIAAFGHISPEEMRFLERLGAALDVDRLARAALDRAAQARNRNLDEPIDEPR